MADTYTPTGNKASTQTKLSKDIFAINVQNHQLLKDVYDAYLSNGRESLATTKTRGQVRGGGKKPWRQKGTGRARFGSSRVPIWRGGGITFGPTGDENYSKNVNKKAKRLALRQALTLAASSKKVIVIESIKASKTAELAKLLNKVGAERRVLLVTEDKTAELIRISRNISSLKLTQVNYLNVFDVLNCDKLVITKAALPLLDTWLLAGKSNKEANL